MIDYSKWNNIVNSKWYYACCVTKKGKVITCTEEIRNNVKAINNKGQTKIYPKSSLTILTPMWI